jgi:phosphonatase-like hydrolase
MIRMVVFDMAGTTVNENNVVYKTLRKSINRKGFDISLDQVLEEGAGKEKSQAIKSILKKYADIENDELTVEIYRDFIFELGAAYKNLDILPQANALELFKILRQKKILIILNTGYDFGTAQNLVDKLRWRRGMEFDDLITAGDVKKNRPYPDMILLAMEKYSIQNAKEVLKVGDSTVDIEEGKNAGCLLNIGITTGAQNYQQLETADPDYIIDNLLELVQIIDRHP